MPKWNWLYPHILPAMIILFHVPLISHLILTGLLTVQEVDNIYLLEAVVTGH